VGPLTPSEPLVMFHQQSQAIACWAGAPDPTPASRAVRDERNWLEVREEPF
jgi:hypothetical protein